MGLISLQIRNLLITQTNVHEHCVHFKQKIGTLPKAICNVKISHISDRCGHKADVQNKFEKKNEDRQQKYRSLTFS